MTNKVPVRNFPFPLVLVFGIVIIILVAGRSWLVNWGIDPRVVMVGNIILFTVSFLSLMLYRRAMSHASTYGFLRNTYSGLMMKMFVCALSVIIYILSAKEHISKGGIFACLFLYFVYTLLEMRSLMQWNKARKNA